MEGAHTAHHIAVLASQLPERSRVACAMDPDNAWGMDQVLAANLVNCMVMLMYSMGDKRRRGPRPQMVGPSWMNGRRRMDAQAMTVDELMEQLSRPRM